MMRCWLLDGSSGGYHGNRTSRMEKEVIRCKKNFKTQLSQFWNHINLNKSGKLGTMVRVIFYKSRKDIWCHLTCFRLVMFPKPKLPSADAAELCGKVPSGCIGRGKKMKMRIHKTQ